MANKCKIVYTDGVAGVFDMNNTPSVLFQEALEYYKDQEQAITAWQVAYSEAFQNEIGIKPENARLKDVLKYLSNKSIETDRLSAEEMLSVSQFMKVNNITSLDDLVTKLNRVFKPNGYFEVSTRAMVDSGLWTQQEANEINPSEILNIINKISSTNLSEDVFVESGTDNSLLIEDVTGEKTILGTYKRIDVSDAIEYALLNSPSKELADIKETLTNSDKYSYVASKMDDSPTLTSNIMAVVNSKMVVNKAFVTEQGVTTSNLSELKTIQNTILLGIDPVEIEADIEFLDSISEDVWRDKKEAVKRVVKGIEKSLIKFNVDIIGLSEIAEVDRTGTLVVLESVNEMLLNPSVESMTRFAEVKTELLNNTNGRVVLPLNEKLSSLNVFYIETELSPSEMLERFNLMKVGDNLYHAIDINTEESYEVLYDRFQNNELSIPNRFFSTENPYLVENYESTLNDIKNFVKSRNVGFETNSQETASLAQLLFEYDAPGKHKTPSKEIENAEYLTTDFISDFYQFQLEEKLKGSDLYDKVLKHFHISDSDINLNSMNIPNITGMKYEKELRDYAELKKEGQIKALATTSTEVIEDIEVINNTEYVKEIEGVNFVVNGDYIVTELNPDMYTRVGENIYRKVYSNSKGEVYKKLSIPSSNVYFTTNLNFDTDVREAKKLLDETFIQTTESAQTTKTIKNNSTLNNKIDKSVISLNLTEIEVDAIIEELINQGEVEYTNEDGLPCS